jgi:hypothetical protein
MHKSLFPEGINLTDFSREEMARACVRACGGRTTP